MSVDHIEDEDVCNAETNEEKCGDGSNNVDIEDDALNTFPSNTTNLSSMPSKASLAKNDISRSYNPENVILYDFFLNFYIFECYYIWTICRT